MIIANTEHGIALRWRDEQGKREEKLVGFSDFSPYFFVKEDCPVVVDSVSSIQLYESWGDRGSTFPLELRYEFGDWVNLDGDKLAKVTWYPSLPKYTKKVKSYFHNRAYPTYEADVRHHYRYSVDMIESIPEYKLRKWYWDMEWMQGGEHDGAITCIVIYDNYDDEYYTLSWKPDSNETEKTVLERFILMINEKDPDMLISWFGWKFDLPKLLERMDILDVPARELSPIKEVDGIRWSTKQRCNILNPNIVNNYSPIAQPIKGRICVPLDLAFERQWNDAQRGTLPSLSLDYVSENVLGEKKLVSEKFPDKNEFFRRGWLEDSDTYLEYAKKDVELLVKIDEQNHTTEAILSLQRLLIAPFDACFYASNMGGIYFMRNASWKAPTGMKGDRVDYDGAMVYDPLSEATNGLHLGVAAFDFAGLYPSMMIARNISWETKSDTPTEFGVNITTPKDFSEIENYDMRYYKTDELGLLPKAVLELKELRNEYKAKMKESESKSEYVKWNNNQLAVKRLMASFYGIIAFQGFGWADVDLAASITASAREAIRTAAFKVREL
jgi:DNA polymerase elongation subunit (family B)|tara:strand:- start:3774 stop:5438 length:1665 start_codon:yes stop_codon:yes gene_type:complete